MNLPKCNTEHFKANSKKVEDIKDVEFAAWFSIYCKKDICNRDAHLQFSELLSISREDAKTLAQRIAYEATKGVYNLGYSV
jgi:hypothetical protein